LRVCQCEQISHEVVLVEIGEWDGCELDGPELYVN
jgi:hypothetical protein